MTRKADMRMVTMREFRNSFQKLKDPVRVVRARGELEFIGIWTPEKSRADRAAEGDGNGDN